ncbi:hypothetical protein [uncultured Ruegeria sp.]|uniref:hypothetical protein n=1 Tax=uncultured Ruegeria sp. TaxID=259304 RepID=UPI00345C1A98
MRKQGVADRLARQWIAEHGEDYVQEKLDYMSERQRDVKSTVGYLSAALREDYRMPDKPEPAEPSPETLEAVRKREETQAREDQAYEARAAERSERARKLAVVEELVSRRNPTQRDADKRLFLSGLTDDLDREHFRAHGWRSGLNSSAIFAFWEELEPDAFEYQR